MPPLPLPAPTQPALRDPAIAASDTAGDTVLWNPAYPVFGADTSLWSLEIDFDQYTAAGASFVIIKALNGTELDPYFLRNYRRAREAGVPVSTYHWLLPETECSIEAQVRAYASLIADYPHDFVPWLDYESEAGAHDLIRYLDLFLETTGRQIGVYSTFGRLNDAVPPLPERFSSLKLWIAKYSTAFPAVPAPFKNWDFWQFTETMPGRPFGFPGDGEPAVDMNYFNGSPEIFTAFCNPDRAGSPQEQLQHRIEWEVPPPPLAPGDTGLQVLKLQDLLIRASFLTNAQVAGAPGTFGPRTRAALINLQAALGLPSTGTYDEVVRAAVIARYYTFEHTPPVDLPPEPPQPPDEVLEQRLLFDGNAVYTRYRAQLDRGYVQYHVLNVDLSNAEIFITPEPLSLSMVPAFLETYDLDIAINGDGWRLSGILGLRRIETTGENASLGRVYGRRRNQESFYFDRGNSPSLKRPPRQEIWNALSFPNILVEAGMVSPRITRSDVDPRTALGFTKDGRFAIMVAVDGRESADSRSRTGMTFAEVAQVLVRHGAWIGSNQDGGGSTTLVVRDERDGQPTILNEPCGELPYVCREKRYSLRPVANHFGIRFLASTPRAKPGRSSPHPSKDQL